MNCQACQVELRRCFDEDAPRTVEVDGHLERCLTCRAYARRLDALDTALADMPLEATSVELDRRLKTIPAAPKPKRTMQLVSTVAALLVMAALTVGYFYPLPEFSWRSLSLEYEAFIPHPSLDMLTWPSLASLEACVKPPLGWFDAVPQLSTPVAAAIAALALVTLAGINGFEAVQWRADRNARRIS